MLNPVNFTDLGPKRWRQGEALLAALRPAALQVDGGSMGDGEVKKRKQFDREHDG